MDILEENDGIMPRFGFECYVHGLLLWLQLSRRVRANAFCFTSYLHSIMDAFESTKLYACGINRFPSIASITSYR